MKRELEIGFGVANGSIEEQGEADKARRRLMRQISECVEEV